MGVLGLNHQNLIKFTSLCTSKSESIRLGKVKASKNGLFNR
jgi:hypothetical protein